jgi:hypothetical protein
LDKQPQNKVITTRACAGREGLRDGKSSRTPAIKGEDMYYEKIHVIGTDFGSCVYELRV